MLWIMKEIVLGIWLGVQGVIDWRYKEIPFWFSLLGGVVGVCFCVIEERRYTDVILACIPGVLVLIIAKLTKEIIGYGDGIVLLAMGFYLSLEALISVWMLAFMIAGMAALILLIVFRKNGNYRIAFLPFLLSSYFIDWWIRYGGKVC